MTSYEIIKAMDKEQVEKLISANIMRQTLMREVRIYDFYKCVLAKNMQCIAETMTGEKFGLCGRSVRRIIDRLDHV